MSAGRAVSSFLGVVFVLPPCIMAHPPYGGYRVVVAPSGYAVPPAARALASRLRIGGAPVVGDRPEGAGRPWTVWFPRIITPGSIGPGNIPRRHLDAAGPALFAGPRGALGEFHYFDSSPLTPTGGDGYRGPPLTRGRAVAIALRWLHLAGAPIPRLPMHVSVAFGSTDIGGTGLCCFTSLASVFWGTGSRLGSFANEPRFRVYVADAGIVVQVDMGAPAGAEGEMPSYPCPGDRRDRNVVALGRWCFSYAAAAQGIIFSEVSFHDGWILDPSMLADRPLVAAHRQLGPLRRVSLTLAQAVYRRSMAGATYEVTLVPAFPGLVGSTWEVVTVRVVRSGPGQIAREEGGRKE